MKIQIVTPDKVINLEESDMLTIPTEVGIIGILDGHAPAIVRVKKGQISFKKDKVMTMVLFSDGYAHILPDSTKIVTEDF